MHLNSLTSYETQLPYDYYSLPFCKPEDGVRKIDSSFNPGNLMSGQQLYNSPYEVLVNVCSALSCALARVEALVQEQRILQAYSRKAMFHLNLLKLATCLVSPAPDKIT